MPALILQNLGPQDPDCAANNAYALRIIRNYNVRRVVLSGYWEYLMDAQGTRLSDVRATVDALHRLGVEVTIIGDNPDFSFSNPVYLSYRLQSRDDPSAPFWIATRNERLQRASPRGSRRGSIYDPMRDLCKADRCLAYENGHVLMTDNAHFSDYGSRQALQRMRWIFER
ncbi:SGNH hydrolase domain-containing protein [Sphingomonas sp. MMS24-JH45]